MFNQKRLLVGVGWLVCVLNLNLAATTPPKNDNKLVEGALGAQERTDFSVDEGYSMPDQADQEINTAGGK
jgi:hypothetical protein